MFRANILRYFYWTHYIGPLYRYCKSTVVDPKVLVEYEDEYVGM